MIRSEAHRRHAVTTGVITLVQETRFEIENGRGGHRLFLLAHDAPLEPADLQALLADGTPVRVEHCEAEGLIAAVAHDVRPVADGTRSAERR
jgi:hypothetical protein